MAISDYYLTINCCNFHLIKLSIMKQILFIALLIAGLSACKSTQKISSKAETTIMYVAGQQVACMGVAPQSCYLVKTDENNAWEFFYSPIDGFEFEQGYRYKLEVAQLKIENPPADASSIKYKLVKVLTKEEDIINPQALYDIWGVVWMNGRDISPATVSQTMELNTAKMSVLGQAGCNNYRGGFKFTDKTNGIEFTPLASTKMYCPNMKYEDEFMKTIASVDSFYRYNQTLIFFSQGKMVLQLRRID
ncbi:DUF4377 domain-containing protein [Marinilabiliaceae bacterium JC017]|nr:DUF4377 domain-containing protein [Marinilabiliaceae bacterium JC017]